MKYSECSSGQNLDALTDGGENVAKFCFSLKGTAAEAGFALLPNATGRILAQLCSRDAHKAIFISAAVICCCNGENKKPTANNLEILPIDLKLPSAYS